MEELGGRNLAELEAVGQRGWQARCEDVLDAMIRLLSCLLVIIGIGIAVSVWQSWRRVEEEQALEQRMRIPFRPEGWTIEELGEFDGMMFPEKPILLAADGRVYNVWRGANFYGVGGTYQGFAGIDATRMLAKHILQPETPEEAAKPLSQAAKEELASWVATFNHKYEYVGPLRKTNG